MPDSFGLQVRLVGPVVEGRAPAAIKVMTQAALEEVADYTKYEVSMELIRVLVNPTGYYESNIVDVPRGPGVRSVNDSGVIYGPWLEGTGSRNASSTFKGYRTFERVRNRMAQKTGAVAEAAVARHMGALE